MAITTRPSLTAACHIAIIALCAAGMLLACGPKAVDVNPEPKADGSAAPAPMTPEEQALSDMASWIDQLPQWTQIAAEPFASDGHEAAKAVLFVKGPDAGAFRDRAFTQGQVLALATYASPEDTDPAHVAFMIRMAPGYDTEGQDWFYANMDAEHTVTLAGPGTEASVAEACGNCHRYGAGGTGFVFGPPAQ